MATSPVPLLGRGDPSPPIPPPRCILVLGFGPFLGIVDNPAAAAARAVNDVAFPGLRVVGREMPVSYARAPALAEWLAERYDASVVLGIGVARGRTETFVERTAVRDGGSPSPDVDGEIMTDLEPEGPPALRATVDVDALAAALGVGVSDDAGRYVCNGWLYRTVRRMPARRSVGFLHVPDAGIPLDTLVRGILGAWGPRA